MQPEILSVTVKDPMTAAILRLAGVSGIHVVGARLENNPDGSIDLTISALVGISVASKPAPVDIDPHFGRVVDPPSPESVTTVIGPGAGASALQLSDVLPAEPDAVFRPMTKANEEPSDEPGAPALSESERQLAIVDQIQADTRLTGVVRSLLRPLASRGWQINGDRETVLRNVAEHYADYRPSQLATAANLLVRGKHMRFPDWIEIDAAIGRAARPGASSAKAEKEAA